MQLQQARARDKQQEVALRGRCLPGRHLQTPLAPTAICSATPAAPLLSHLRAVCRTEGILSQAHPPHVEGAYAWCFLCWVGKGLCAADLECKTVWTASRVH